MGEVSKVEESADDVGRNRAQAFSAGEEQHDLYPPLPTTRHEIEVILVRQLAGYLALPIVIVDPSHVVVYYNEPAERLLGRRFDEGGPIPWADWSDTFDFTDDAEGVIPPNEMPLAVALSSRRPAHRTIWMRGLDGIRRRVETTAIPLIGNAGRFLGATAFLTEIEE